MRVGIDISKMHSFSKQRGIGFYTKNLIEALKKYTKIKLKVIEGKQSTSEGLDIIHYPFFDLFRATLPLRKKLPTIVTIHDVTPLVFPKHYPPGISGKINHVRQKLALKGVKAVITDSESSRKDIVKYLKLSHEKVNVVYPAPAKIFRKLTDLDYLRGVRSKYKLPESFALYAGSVNWNKNLLNMGKACIDTDIDLVLVGKDFEVTENLEHKELREFREFKEKYSEHPKIHILGFVENEELVGILNLASVLLLVSHYEGFGLPILEAQACGVPVITSKVSSTGEIASDSALLLDPDKVEDIVGALKRIRNDDLRENLIKAGFKNVERFSWEKTALKTYSVYEQVLKRS